MCTSCPCQYHKETPAYAHSAASMNVTSSAATTGAHSWWPRPRHCNSCYPKPIASCTSGALICLSAAVLAAGSIQ